MKHIAVDIGAGSGRIMVGWLQNGEIHLEEIYRFDNKQVTLKGRLYWDFLALFDNVKKGLKMAFSRYHNDIHSIAVDTWGVDYGLINKYGNLIGNPVCYRDARTVGLVDFVYKEFSKEKLFSLTGLQTMEINTIFQLINSQLQEPEFLRHADKLLFMPDLFNYFLTGVAANEYTIATTSQLFNPLTKEWEKSLFEKFEIPFLCQKVIYPPTVIGSLLPEVANEVNGNAKVIAVGSHDTASAIAAIKDDDTAFISSGTWSLMGIKSDKPILTQIAMNNDFTNEGICHGQYSFLKNITGLWLLQCLMNEWKSAGGSEIDYSEMIMGAEKSRVDTIFDVEDLRLVNPPIMSEMILTICEETSQEKPITKADFMRVICRSLASKYAEVKEKIKLCSGKKINKIVVVGGGSKNGYLMRMTGEFCKCDVEAGPVEATAIGNVMMQMEIMKE